jgi:hypothetical protein
VWFNGIDSTTKFAVYAAQIGGSTEKFCTGFGISSPEIQAKTLSQPLVVATKIVQEFSPDALALMEFREQRDIDIATKMYDRWPKFGQRLPTYPVHQYMAEIHMGENRVLFSEDSSGLPLYEGRMVTNYDHRAKAYREGRGRAADWEELPFDEPKSIQAQWHIPASKVPSKALARTKRYRIGFSDLARAGTERTFTAALLPPDTIAGHTVPTFTYSPEGEYAYISWLAAANSFTLDWLARQKVTLHMSLSILDSFPIPRLAAKSPLLLRLAPLVLGLSCTGSEMLSFWDKMAADKYVTPRIDGLLPGLLERDERLQAISEIEAIVAYHLYGLERDDLAHILDTFLVVKKREEKEFGDYVTKRRILAAYDAERLAGPPALPTIESEFPAAANSEQSTNTTHAPANTPPASTAADAPPSQPSSGTFRLEPPPAPRQRRLTSTPAPASPPPSQPGGSPGFTLAPPPASPARLPATVATPPTHPADPPTEPRLITALRDTGGALARPDVLALLRALHDSTTPMSKAELIAAAPLDESRWTPISRLLLDAGLIVKEGDRRTTRYKLA